MLAPRKRIGLKTMYFTSNTSSMRAAQYRDDPKACVYFCDRRFFRGVMLTGTMEVLEDSESREMIWQEGDICNKGKREKRYTGYLTGFCVPFLS